MQGGPSQTVKRILLVEDDSTLSTSLCYSLEASGYKVTLSRRGEDALRIFSEFRPDIILLDTVLPDIPGFEVCRRIRAVQGCQQPAIIIATAKAQEADRVASFEVGADDFVSKPFSLSELMLRIQARLQGRNTGENAAIAPPAMEEAEPEATHRITLGPLEIDRASHRVFLSGKEINLSVQEMRLLIYLASEPGKMHARRDLLTAVWSYHPEAASRTLDTHIKRLRDKFGPFATMIQTVHGVGYRLTMPLHGTRNTSDSRRNQRRR
jgi:two-component system phosphate regulon response regulator PhoB